MQELHGREAGKEMNLPCPKVALSGRLLVTEMRLAIVGGREPSGRGQQRSDSHRPPSYPPSSVLFDFLRIAMGVAV
ncbi:hypothetical protein CSPAE12_11572 [Colletotrichum incanum]|nr:hypothetical protein CSPAE12_11572 [Colletotrichum incanum]